MDFDMMQLKHRVNVFSKIISSTVCTNFMHKHIELEDAMSREMNALRDLRVNHGNLYIIGNGGSAAVASHALVDFINVAKIRAQVLHESSLVTCMANDFGYENVYARVLSQIMRPQDMLIAISSSGRSINICNAAKVVKEQGGRVVTFTGFHKDNLLRNLGDVNFWLDSDDYGFIEIGHQFILHNLVDRFSLENKTQTHSNIENIVMA